MFKRVHESLFIIALLSLLIQPVSILAGIIHVPGDQPTIQAGVDAAVDGDTILIASGTYAEPMQPEGAMVVIEDLSLSLIADGAVTLDAQGAGQVLDCEGLTIYLEGLTFVNGDVYRGGAVHIYGSYSRFVDCAFQDNTATQGGAVFQDGGAAEYENCEFIGNSSSWGGAIVAEVSSCIATSCQFVGNSSQGSAGALFISEAPLTIFDCEFTSNEADNKGGAIQLGWYSYGSTIDQCIFTDNSAGVAGGAIAATSDGAYASINNSVFIGNTAPQGGWTWTIWLSRLRFTNCTLVGDPTNPLSGGCCIEVDFDSSNSRFNNCILAYSGGTPIEVIGTMFPCWPDCTTWPPIQCTNIFGNTGGDWVYPYGEQAGQNGNFSADPLFCDLANGDLTLDGMSPCLPYNNDCGVLIGALGAGCNLTGVDPSVPTAFALISNHPNPFNPDTEIQFELSEAVTVDLKIYNLAGRLVRCLIDDDAHPAGGYSVSWNGKDDAGQSLPSGIYFARIIAGSFEATQKMTMLK